MMPTKRRWPPSVAANAPVEQRLSQRIDKNGAGGCWMWTGALSCYGYGVIQIAGKVCLVHRVVWQRTIGPILDWLCVLHRCDVRACCNPAHLFLGTKTDNNNDREAKGRTLRGVQHGKSKLNPDIVRTIRSLNLNEGMTARQIGRRMNLNSGTVCSVLIGKTWCHVE